MVQDIFPHRLNNSYKVQPIKQGDTVIIFSGRQVAVIKKSESDITLPTYSQIEKFVSEENLRYLFSVDNVNGESDDSTAFWLFTDSEDFTLPKTLEYLEFATMRNIKYPTFREIYFTVVTAYHLYSWYRDNRFCGRCGKLLRHSESERVLGCPTCKFQVYPRISPAVIIGVTNGNKILMSRYAGRTYKGYALLAGFAEIGETLEQTVEREVMEEVGLRVKNIRYYKSQPGGVDGNLLSGFFCELDGEDTLNIDTEELAEARWYSREEIPVEDDGYSLTFEMIGHFKRGNL